MPIFLYRVLNGKNPDEYIEVEQSLDSAPLTQHPVTNEEIEKVVQPSNLVLKHGDRIEANKLNPDHLKKHGFSVYQRSNDSKKYKRTIGTSGPDSISSPQ